MVKKDSKNWSAYRIFKTAASVLAILAILWFVAAFMIKPLADVFQKAFFPGGNFSFDNIRKVFQSDSVRKTIFNTLLMSVLTVICVNIVGLFQILVCEYFDIKGAKIAKLLFFVPLVLTSTALITGLQFLFNEYSVVNLFLQRLIPGFNTGWFTGFWAVLYVHAFFFNSYFILFVRTTFKKIDYSTIEAAKSLGASPFQAFVKVALPTVLPAILSSSVLTFITALASNATPTMVGGEFQMINSRITLLSSLGKRDMAAVLALILGLLSVLFMMISNRIEKRGNFVSTSKVQTKIRKVKIKNPAVNVLVHALTYLMCLIYAVPVITIAVYSFTDAETILTKRLPTHLSLENYIRVFTSKSGAFRPILNSFLSGGMGTLLALVIGVISAILIFKSGKKWVRILELALLIPWIVPSSMMGLGLLIGYDVPSAFTFGNALIGTWWMLPIGYAVISIPTIVRMTRASLFGVNTSLEESAQSLGSGPLRTFFTVVFPVILPSVISAAAQSFNSKMTEYTITALLYAPKYTPLGIAFKNGSETIDKNSYANNLVYIMVTMVIGIIIYAVTSKAREE